MRAGAAPQPEPPALLEELPSWLLAQCSAHAQHEVAGALAPAGLRRHHFAVLAALGERGATSQVELGRRLGLDRSDLHAVLAALTRHGLVERVRDADDRRRNLVALTGAGSRSLGELTARVHQAQAAVLEPLSGPERQHLVELLARVHRHHAASTLR